jgi:hypothetical protein
MAPVIWGNNYRLIHGHFHIGISHITGLKKYININEMKQTISSILIVHISPFINDNNHVLPFITYLVQIKAFL